MFSVVVGFCCVDHQKWSEPEILLIYNVIVCILVTYLVSAQFQAILILSWPILSQQRLSKLLHTVKCMPLLA